MSVSADNNLGSPAGAITFNGGTLQVTGTTFTATPRVFNWGPGGGGFDIADPTNIFTVGQMLDGPGQLTKLGAGTLTLVSANSYSGGTTMTGGTLQVTDNASIGTGAGVFDGGTFQSVSDNLSFANPFFVNTAGGTVDTSGYTLTLSGPIANGDGPGGLTATGFGVLVLTGTGSYTGGTTIAGGKLILGNGGTSGSIVGDVVDDGLLGFDRSDTLVLPGVISGSGYVGQYGTGTTVLTGDNSYDGGTTISDGTLQLGNGGTSGSIVGDVLDEGRLAFERSDTLSFGGTIFGAGSVAQIGPGTTVLTADNTYTGGTTISAGTLQLGDGGDTGSILGDVLDNGQLAFDRSDTVTFPRLVSGTGSLAQIGTGTTVLTADNAYTGGTTISAGALQLGDGGTSGSIVGNVLDNGVLGIDRADMLVVPGVISGSGRVLQFGDGDTVLTGDSTYTGGTTIADGTLWLGNGGTSGSIIGDVLDNGVLAFDRSDRFSVPGVISGTGYVAQIGTGTTVLAADST